MSKENKLLSKPELGNDFIAVVSGSFIKERYIKCPHSEKQCKWRMKNDHKKGYEYLNNSCYLSGSFKLECPD